MTSACFRFERFTLDPTDRQLRCEGRPVELNGRYLDALALLVRENGRLVSKDRFLEEVWRGVPVTDEALTQCIRTLRRQLGDDAARPRFIETVPKHGYRFIAPVDSGVEQAGVARPAASRADVLQLGLAGTLGGGMAGAVGGLFYGLVAASNTSQPSTGAASILLVLVCVSMLIGALGGAGVSLGIALAGRRLRSRSSGMIAGGALGGLVIGAVVKLLGIDAFTLLLGRSPGDITGPFEGVLLGGAVGLGAMLAGQRTSRRRALLLAAISGGSAGLVIPLLGGKLMGGSLNLLTQSYPASRLDLDRIGVLLGEQSFGPVSLAVTSFLEGALFTACITGAVLQLSRTSKS